MNKREEMLEAALSLFAAEGYDNVGIQKIVDACNVKKPTLYHYFGSKNGILQEFLSLYFDPFLAELEQKTAYNGDLTLTLENTVKAYFRFAAENDRFYRLYLSMVYSPKDTEAHQAILPVLERQFKLLDTMFTAAEKQHGNMRGRSKRYTFTFMGMINSYITTSYYGQIALSDESAFLACKQFMHGILS